VKRAFAAYAPAPQKTQKPHPNRDEVITRGTTQIIAQPRDRSNPRNAGRRPLLLRRLGRPFGRNSPVSFTRTSAAILPAKGRLSVRCAFRLLLRIIVLVVSHIVFTLDAFVKQKKRDQSDPVVLQVQKRKWKAKKGGGNARKAKRL